MQHAPASFKHYVILGVRPHRDNSDIYLKDSSLLSILCSWDCNRHKLCGTERARGGGATPAHFVWGAILSPDKYLALAVDIYQSTPGFYKDLRGMDKGLKEIVNDYSLGVPQASFLGIVPEIPHVTPAAFSRHLIGRLDNAWFSYWIRSNIICGQKLIDARLHVTQNHNS